MKKSTKTDLAIAALVLAGGAGVVGYHSYQKEQARKEADRRNAEDDAVRQAQYATEVGVAKAYAAASTRLLSVVADNAPIVASELPKARGRRVAALLHSSHHEWTAADKSDFAANPEYAEASALIDKPGQLYCAANCPELVAEPWFATDPAALGMLVLVDRKMRPIGEFVEVGRDRSDGPFHDTAFVATITFRAVLIPEAVVVASWTRVRYPPPRKDSLDFENITDRFSLDELKSDLLALQRGEAPASEPQPAGR
jgi:hypothetical protein